jgi:hypothetical protein
MEGEKIRKILLVFTLLSWVLLLVLIKNSGKDCLDGKMRVQGSSYDINNDVDTI